MVWLFNPGLNTRVAALMSGDACAEFMLAEFGPLATVSPVISNERLGVRLRTWGPGLGGESGLSGERADAGGVSTGIVSTGPGERGAMILRVGGVSGAEDVERIRR